MLFTGEVELLGREVRDKYALYSEEACKPLVFLCGCQQEIEILYLSPRALCSVTNARILELKLITNGVRHTKDSELKYFTLK